MWYRDWKQELNMHILVENVLNILGKNGGESMIEIKEIDMPITVAEKLITAVREVTNPITKNIYTEDMFTDDELKEIAAYLLVYCEAHK
jgi:hypothetical protein